MIKYSNPDTIREQLKKLYEVKRPINKLAMKKDKEIYELLREALEYICEPASKRLLKKRSELIERGKLIFPKLTDYDASN